MTRSPRLTVRTLPVLLALAGTQALAGEAATVPGSTVPEPARWEVVGQQTASLLSEYLQVDTVNPPGNELAGARFLADVLRESRIAAEIHEYTPGRANLVARLPSTGEAPPVCLLSHIDVATFEADSWPEESQPLSGHIDEDGLVWGRGALDMKGMTAIQVAAMRELVSHGVPLRRDVILLAVADEEIDNTGVKALIADHWEELGCTHVINEGGLGLRDLFFEGQPVYPVSVGEKGVLWVRMVAAAEPGHGSTPVPGRSPEVLRAALDRVASRSPRPSYHPALLELLDNVGAHAGGLPGFILQRPGLVRLMLRGRFMGDPLTRAVVTDTVNITGLGGALQPNVVPGESWANLDIRLLPGTSPEEILAELTELVDDERVRFEVLSQEPAAVSEWQGDPVYEALVARVTEGQPEAVAGPAISPGFTDSIYLRPLGVRAYGLVPFLVTPEQAITMHGNGEHVSTENLEQGVRVLYRVLVDVAADPEGRFIPPEAPAPTASSPSPSASSEQPGAPMAGQHSTDSVVLAGVARNAKGGAILVTDDGRTPYLLGRSSWPEGVEGRRVVVRGTPGSDHILPEARVLEDGALTQGVMPGSGPQDFLRDTSWSFEDRPESGLEPAPWAISWSDGSGNSTRIWQAAPGSTISWSYDPVTPLESSSGTYSGGEPAAGELDEGAAVALWARALAMAEHTELHAEARTKGSLQLELASTERGRQVIVLRPTPVVQGFAETITALRDD